MAKTCINYPRIAANAGLAFCTTLLATGLNAESALLNAGLIGAVALFTELKSETEPKTPIKRAVSKAQQVLSTGLVA